MNAKAKFFFDLSLLSILDVCVFIVASLQFALLKYVKSSGPTTSPLTQFSATRVHRLMSSKKGKDLLGEIAVVDDYVRLFVLLMPWKGRSFMFSTCLHCGFMTLS